MFFVRHGQSEFNVEFSITGRDPGVRDAPITVRGQKQALGAARHLKGKNITRMMCSPYTRALQTASIIAEHLGIKTITAQPLAGERKLYSCDIGTPLSELKKKWPAVDFVKVEKEEWWPASDETEDDIMRRTQGFTTLYGDVTDEATTAIVSHWYFIFTLSGKDTENGQIIRRDTRGLYHREGL
jgi:glucosyl-3-phosphoglycerate phosphatase